MFLARPRGCASFMTLASSFLSMVGMEEKAPMSCAMIYWGKNYDRFFSVFCRFGAVVDLRKLKGKRLGQCSDTAQLELMTEEESCG